MVQKVEAIGYRAAPQVASAQETMAVDTEANISASLGTPAGSLFQDVEQSKRKRAEIARKRNLLILGNVLSLPVVTLSMFFMNRVPGQTELLLGLTTPV